MINAWECFHHAALELVRSTPIKQRLICAYRAHLAEVREEQLPGEIRAPFGRIMRSLCGVPPLRGEDAVAASVRKMSNQDADDCAAMIVEMFCLMSRAQAAQRPHGAPLKLHSIEAQETGEYEIPALIANH